MSRVFVALWDGGGRSEPVIVAAALDLAKLDLAVNAWFAKNTGREGDYLNPEHVDIHEVELFD